MPILLLIERPQTNGGDYFFGVIGEIAVHHPLVIAGFAGKNLLHGHTLVLSEVEDLLVFVVVHNATGQINRFVVAGRVAVQKIYIVLYFGIALQLTEQDFVGGGDVSLCAVGVFEVFAAVKAVSGLQIAGFVFVEDGLYVHKLAVSDIEIYLHPQKLLNEHGQVEIIGVVACKIAIAHELVHLGCKLAKSRHVFHIGIVNAVDLAGFGRNGHFGIDALVQHLAGAIGQHFQHRNLYNAVGGLVEAGGFEVEKSKGTFEREHFIGLSGKDTKAGGGKKPLRSLAFVVRSSTGAAPSSKVRANPRPWMLLHPKIHAMKKVLLLDDERISHLILNRMSNDSQLDWQIRDVYFWDEAARLLQSQTFDLILADVHLQNHQQVWTLLEGMENRKQQVPVVIITGQADEATLRESRRFPMVRAVIEKPVPLALLPQINQWVA